MCSISPHPQNHVDEHSMHVTLNEVKSPLMKDFLSKVIELSKVNANIIIAGEQGTGKQWYAELIHKLSTSGQATLLHLSCESYTPQLLDEAFPSFLSSAEVLKNKGCNANILIDNFFQLPSEQQVRLLDFLVKAQAELTAISGEKNRFIFTVDSNFNRVIKSNYIWNYLSHFFNPVSIIIPPLREHREDIFPYIDLFIEQASSQLSGSIKPVTSRNVKISDQALYKCITYDWPGNVRQLKNAVTHAFISAKGKLIMPDDLPGSLSADVHTNPKQRKFEQNLSYKNAEKQLLDKIYLEKQKEIFTSNIATWIKSILKKNI